MAPSPLAPPRPSAAVSGRPQVVQGFFAGNRPRAVIQPHRPGAVQPRVLGSAMQLPPGTLTLRPHGTGQRLPEAVQRKMSDLFQADFSDVRVHVGNEAASIGALAFTHGSDLYFAPGQYNPHAPHGQRLIAHELTHVIQQRAGRVRNPFGAGVAVVQDPGLEAEAERMGRNTGMPYIQARSADVSSISRVVQRVQKEPVPPKFKKSKIRSKWKKIKNNNEYFWKFSKTSDDHVSLTYQVVSQKPEEIIEITGFHYTTSDGKHYWWNGRSTTHRTEFYYSSSTGHKNDAKPLPENRRDGIINAVQSAAQQFGCVAVEPPQ